MQGLDNMLGIERAREFKSWYTFAIMIYDLRLRGSAPSASSIFVLIDFPILDQYYICERIEAPRRTTSGWWNAVHEDESAGKIHHIIGMVGILSHQSDAAAAATFWG